MKQTTASDGNEATFLWIFKRDVIFSRAAGMFGTLLYLDGIGFLMYGKSFAEPALGMLGMLTTGILCLDVYHADIAHTNSGSEEDGDEWMDKVYRLLLIGVPFLFVPSILGLCEWFDPGLMK